MKAPILTATTASCWVNFLALFGALEKREHRVKAKSNYRGYNQKSSSLIYFIHFFIDNYNANISLYTLNCPDFNLGQLKLYKMKFTLELSMKK